MVWYRYLAIRIVSGALAVTLSIVVGIALVNDYYGYYQSWSQLNADLSGTYNAGPATKARPAQIPQPAAGRIESVLLPGKRSGISRTGLVFLPPQYFEP